ncbi:hypothetical protein Acr_12g0000250 [Actinidia rufa]|uniref:Uncharacterized protein n=1 Tax=Actinidia rufa TaxID=165716 RepID=A0A7J0FFL2_9ERIC|nr:hypothetical protein Acr_12g0000250 [Actinidia rufa]
MVEPLNRQTGLSFCDPRQATSDEANPGPGDVDSGRRMPKALDLKLSRFNLNSDRLPRHSPAFVQASPLLDRPPTGCVVPLWASHSLPRCSLDLRQASPLLVEPSTNAGTFSLRVVDRWLRIWHSSLHGVLVSKSVL